MHLYSILFLLIHVYLLCVVNKFQTLINLICDVYFSDFNWPDL